MTYSIVPEKTDPKEVQVPKEDVVKGKVIVRSLQDFIRIYQSRIAIAEDPSKEEEDRRSALLRAQSIEISIQEEILLIQSEVRSIFLSASRSITQDRVTL